MQLERPYFTSPSGKGADRVYALRDGKLSDYRPDQSAALPTLH